MRKIFVFILLLLIATALSAQAPLPPPSESLVTPAKDAPAPDTPAKSVVGTPAPPVAATTSGPTNAVIPRGSKFYIAPIPGGYDIYLTAAIANKKVPITVVVDRSKADYEISAVTETEKAGWAKMLFGGTDASNEQASIAVLNIKTGEIVYGYNVNKRSSARGKQSSSEACAKHLKEKIEGGN